VTTEEIFEGFLSDDRAKTFFHGHSYTANPLACAVALASLDIFRTEKTLDRVKALECKFKQRLERLRSFARVGEVRGIGGVGIIELVEDKLTKSAGGYLAGIGPRLYGAFLERGLLLRPLGNVLYFMPPYVVSDDEVDWAFDQIESVLSDLDATSNIVPAIAG
jgi:adenosylmethionine-8-amino-7-oxononanoate aminotransferase